LQAFLAARSCAITSVEFGALVERREHAYAFVRLDAWSGRGDGSVCVHAKRDDADSIAAVKINASQHPPNSRIDRFDCCCGGFGFGCLCVCAVAFVQANVISETARRQDVALEKVRA